MERSVPVSSAGAPPVESLLAGSLQGVLVASEGEIVFANAVAADMLDADGPAQLQGQPLTRFFADEDVRSLSAAGASGGARPPRTLARARSLQGRALPVQACALAIPWQRGEALQLTLLDRSELETAQAELEQWEGAFRQIIDGSLQGIYVHVEHRFLFCNQTFADMFGYASPEEVLALGDVLACYAPPERERLLGFYQARVGGGRPPVRYEFQGLRKDGGTIWLENQVRVVNWQGQQAILATVIDVSERKRAEQELQASEERYRNLVEGSMQGLLIQRNRRALFANSAFARLFGFDSPEEVYALPDLQVLIAEDAREQMSEYSRRRLSGAGAPERYLGHGRRKDGSEIWIENLVRVVNWEGQPAIQVAGIDVTERLRAERELEAQRRLLQTVFDTIPHAVYVKDRDLRYRMANRAFCEAFRMAPEQILDQRIEDIVQDLPHVQKEIAAADHRVFETGRPQELVDLRVELPDGRLGWRHVIKYPLQDEHGEVAGLVGITEDVTERHDAVERLRASERLLRTVIDTIPHAVYVKDRDGRFRIANSTTAVYFQRGVESILGKTFRELGGAWTPDKEAVERADLQVMETGQPMELPEVELCMDDGRALIRRVVKIPLLDERGQVTGVVGVLEDITERKRVEEELRSSRMLLQTVFNLLPLWVFVKDPQRRFLMVNRQMAEDYAIGPDVKPGELLDLGTTITEEERSVIYQLDQRVLDTGERVEIPEVQITLPRGGTRLFRTVRMALLNADGVVAGIVGIAEDITERRRTEQAIQQAQKLESLGVLAGGIAHDFNNLLVAILGNASLAMLDLPGDSSALGPLAQIETAGERAAELCRQMLAYSGKGSFEIASVHLNALIQEMTQLLRVSLARPILLTYNFDPALPALEVDPTQIRQVVMNLVMNAAEAIGERPGAITLTTAVVHCDREDLAGYIQGEQLSEGRYVRLEVVDTGEGIAPEMLGRIFDPFFTTKFAGRGLGLAAVLGIVRGHGGAMQVVSAPEEGSTFRMLLPVREVAAASPPRAVTGPHWRGEGTVLVVDDEEDVRDVLDRMLVSLGFQVLSAADGKEGLARLEEHAADIRLVVLDMTMPRLDGEQTLRVLRERHAGLPVVVVSGFAERDVKERFAALGVSSVLQKPFTLQTLAARLQALLG
jgi:PAS domain S-box-containing protein